MEMEVGLAGVVVTTVTVTAMTVAITSEAVG